MKGVRYYLPRPFLYLKQSTPVAQRVALVSFKLENGKYVLELPDDAPTWLRRAAPRQISITQALAASLASQAATNGALKLQSTPGGGETNAVPSTASGGPNVGQTTNRPPSELHARTGFINETDPVTRLGDRMDVVYLPDFEEQYVIQPRTGLGTTDIETRLRNGWAAEVFSQKVDNSNLIPYVIDQFERASEAAAGIFTTWAPVAAGLPPGTSPAKLLNMQSKSAGEVEAAVRDFLGDVLIFKIAEVKVAQPGLYPILKPREISQWLKYAGVVSASDPDATFELFLKNAKTPWIRPDMAFIPCPPFTMIGFNVTSDIFISPATERVSQVAASGEGSGGNKTAPSSEGDALKIKEKLASSKEKLDISLQPKVDWDKIEISSIATASTITIGLKEVVADANKADVEQKLKTWLKEVLTVDPLRVELTSLGGAKSTAGIEYNMGVGELAKKLKP